MQPIRLLGPVMLVAGLACLGLAVARGEAAVSLVVVFPLVTGSGPLTLAGILLTFLGFFATFLFWPGRPVEIVAPEGSSAAAEDSSGPAPTRRWGGVVFLGPFPIVFGSDPRMTRMMLLVGILLFVALLALALFALLG
ncbi:MAG TPA: DUF131 domain-containing protein [Thermoplasmata archaeon]